MVLDEDVPGQQLAGRDQLVDRVRVQRGAIVDLPRQHEPRAEHGDGDQEQREAVGADAGKVRVHEEGAMLILAGSRHARPAKANPDGQDSLTARWLIPAGDAERDIHAPEFSGFVVLAGANVDDGVVRE